MKYILAVFGPWFAFFAGDYFYGSSHMIFHHPCESVYLGCLTMDMLSFGLKGLISGVFISALLSSKKQFWLSLCSMGLLVALITLRLIGVNQWDYLLDPYLYLSIHIPIFLGCALSLFIWLGVKKVIPIKDVT
ncbi:hypothetical protein KFE80_08240 [bacterium SCSIO 12696]|nr:hypothetical protein KFE80_08240 [bacterium SCSIO 12696]